MNNVLVVAAHADDEALGCGGTIVKHVEQGDKVSVVFLTDGVGARGNDDSASERGYSAEKALKILGVSKTMCFDLPDNEMDSVSLLTIAKKIEGVISIEQPNIIYTHFFGDLNIDHQITNRAVLTACRPQKTCSVKEIYCFEVLSSTEWGTKAVNQFVPHKIVDITNVWDKKISALKCYEQEMRSSPHSRSYRAAEALACLRGETHGFNKAEAFYVERILT